jgi:Ca2+-binding EF-hand superfamily protein
MSSPTTTKRESKRSAISNFIMKICALERYIEVKRQMLCDKNDFEPYVAFQRLTRSLANGITPSNVQRFLSENLIDLSLERCRNLLSHYDSDKDSLLSYKEFLEIVLPKEHPDLRAFVTQRECYDIKEEEYLSYETEAAMAILLEREIAIFEEAMAQKDELDNLALSGHKIVEVIDGDEGGNLNFNNLQRYLHDCGLMPYDSEIISFLRRVDRDDDGVITGEELDRFLERFVHSDNVMQNIRRRTNFKATNESRLKTFSPGRMIVSNKLSMLSPSKGNLGLAEGKRGKENVAVVTEVLKRPAVVVERPEMKTEEIKEKKSVTVVKKDGSAIKRTNVRVQRVQVQQAPNNMSLNTSLNKNEPQEIKKTYTRTTLIKREGGENKPPTSTVSVKKTTTQITQNEAPKQEERREKVQIRNSYASRGQNSHYRSRQAPYESKTRPPLTSKPQQNQPTEKGRRSQLAYNRSRERLYRSRKSSKPNDSMLNNTLSSHNTSLAANPVHIQSAQPTVPSQLPKPYTKTTVVTKSILKSPEQSKTLLTSSKKPEPLASGSKRPVTRIEGGASKSSLRKISNRNLKMAMSPKMTKNTTGILKSPPKSNYRSPVKKNSNKMDNFVEALSDIIEEERLLEDARILLVNQPDFYASEIFKMIDRRQRGKFTFEEFRFFLSQIGVIHTDTRSLVDLYSNFDSNQNCLLGQQELNEMLKPNDSLIAVNLEKLPAETFKGISAPTIEMVATCFNRLFSLRKTITKVKRRLKEESVDLNVVFDELDVEGKGFLEKKDFERFLVKIIPEFKETRLDEVNLFTKKCDLDRDGRVNFKDFYMFFSL